MTSPKVELVPKAGKGGRDWVGMRGEGVEVRGILGCSAESRVYEGREALGVDLDLAVGAAALGRMRWSSPRSSSSHSTYSPGSSPMAAARARGKLI